MALTLTLTPSSGSIHAEVSGLDVTHLSDRHFSWYLDGRLKTKTVCKPGQFTHSTVLAPVYFASHHEVRVEIYGDDELYANLIGETDTTYASIPRWTWTGSNVEASAEQTAAAYTAATGQGLTADFHHKVWNDLVAYAKTVLDAAGLSWIGGDAVMSEADKVLYARDFNRLVDNIRYPFWTWSDQPGSYGYLGRLIMLGGDVLYGQYLIELTERLNTMVSLYNGTANTLETGYREDLVMVHASSLLTRRSAPMSGESMLGALQIPKSALRTYPRVLLSGAEPLIFTSRAPLTAQPSAQLAERNYLRLWESAFLVAGVWVHILADHALSISGRFRMAYAPALSFGVDSASVLDAHMVLGLAETLPMGAASAAEISSSAQLYRCMVAGINASLPVAWEMAAALKSGPGAAIMSAAATQFAALAEMACKRAGSLSGTVPVSHSASASILAGPAALAAGNVALGHTVSGGIAAAHAAGSAGHVILGHASGAELRCGASASISGAAMHSSTAHGGMTKSVPAPVIAGARAAHTVTAEIRSARPAETSGSCSAAADMSGLLVSSNPHYIHGAAQAAAEMEALPVMRPTVRQGGHSGNVISFVAGLAMRGVVNLAGSAGITAVTVAALEIEGEKDWEYPVPVGDKLKITQVYEISTMGGVLELDAKLWDYPTADGDKLLIIQAYNPVPMDGVLEFDGDTFAVPYAYSVTETGDKLEVE